MIEVEVRDDGEPQRGRFFHPYTVNTTRCSHLRPIWAIDIANSSQFDANFIGQSCGNFQLGGCLSTHTTAIWSPLKHIRQAWFLKKALGKVDQWTIGNDAHMDITLVYQLSGGDKYHLLLGVLVLANLLLLLYWWRL